jgi:hypothetical protein
MAQAAAEAPVQMPATHLHGCSVKYRDQSARRG